jgi:hypothetical protein
VSVTPGTDCDERGHEEHAAAGAETSALGGHFLCLSHLAVSDNKASSSGYTSFEPILVTKRERHNRSRPRGLQRA